MVVYVGGKAEPREILVDTGPTTITKSWYDDGTLTDTGTVTIGIVDGNGAAVVAAGTATTDGADGTYSYALAVRADVTVLVASWTDGTETQVSKHEVIGGRLFTEVQARAFDGAAMTSASTYTDEAIANDRLAITDLLEDWTERSWIPRYCRVELPGTGSREIWLRDGIPRLSNGDPLHRPGWANDASSIISATASGTAVTVGNVVIDGGRLVRTDGVWTAATPTNPLNVVVEYQYGLPYGKSGSDRIGLMLLRDRLVPSNISDRAQSFSDELGTYRFTTPGVGGAVSNVPEVNDWVRRHTARVNIG